MSEPLSDAEVTMMVRHWFNQKNARPFPEPKPAPQRPVGIGDADAAAIHALIDSREEYEPTKHAIKLYGWQCMNCGETSRNAEDGYCPACSGGD